MINQVEYYNNIEVRKRIAEYCGGDITNPKSFSAEYLVGYGEALQWEGNKDAFISTDKTGFNWILDKGLDIFRSIWDRESLVALLDIEYFNMDYGGEIYLRQNESFQKLEPIYKTIKQILSEYGIEHLVIVTGQGYHFSMKIPKKTYAFLECEKIGNLIDSLKGKYKRPSPRRQKFLSQKYGKSFDGLGRIMEYLSHLIIEKLNDTGYDGIPVVTTDVAVGPSENGREGISIDLSAWADPLYMRDIRCPFSTHQKHRVQRYKVGDSIADNTPIQVSLIRNDNDSIENLLGIRRHYQKSAERAALTQTYIPDASAGFKNLFSDYYKSELSKFHKYYDEQKMHSWLDWDKTYHRLNLNDMPPCISEALKNPNDNLLKPTNIQGITRYLMAHDWHPIHIAGLIRSKYESDFGWGNEWNKYDAGSRAYFYVRMFAGMIYTKLDRLMDFNCVSYQEKKFCIHPWCGYNLRDVWSRL